MTVFGEGGYMKEKIIAILNDVNEEITKYEGDNLFEDGILDSLKIINIVAELEENLGIEIDASYVTEVNFKTCDAIVNMVLQIVK